MKIDFVDMENKINNYLHTKFTEVPSEKITEASTHITLVICLYIFNGLIEDAHKANELAEKNLESLRRMTNDN